MKKILIFSIILSLNSCSSIKEHNSKNTFVDEFKFRYFQKCLLYSFNNSKEINNILNNDNSGYSEPILSQEAYKTIDSLAMQAYKTIKTDSLKSINKKAEGGSGKIVFNKILKDYNSKWLQNIAKREYKKSVKYNF